MKIITVIGARPQIIKAAAVSHVLRQKHQEILVHTGQHYDKNMSDVFFAELNIPHPDFNLGIGSGSHGEQTGQMLILLEKLYLKEKPDIVLVYGDTNSTLAGALAASKLLIPIAHVEAGLRSFNRAMPEEQNRILTDHLSTWLFTPTKIGETNLNNEGIHSGIHNVGDVMYDGVLFFQKRIPSNALDQLGIKQANDYILATVHRAENTNNPKRLSTIINALNHSNENIVLPLHPRTLKYINEYGLQFNDNVQIIDSVGYLNMLALIQRAKKIITDSGGVQKEAYFMARPCITIRDQTEWVETVQNGWNNLVGADEEKIINSIQNFQPNGNPPLIFGDGCAAEKILKILDI